MIVIAIIGILAAIALPAYSSYMKKAKFTEVSNVVESVKTPFALCVQEFGVTNLTNCTNGDGKTTGVGFGWEIKAKGDYATKYVSTIEVTPSSLGTDTATGKIVTITATPVSDLGGANATLILEGYWTAAGQLNWKVSGDSKCVGAKLCKADTAAASK